LWIVGVFVVGVLFGFIGYKWLNIGTSTVMLLINLLVDDCFVVLVIVKLMFEVI